MALGSHPTYSSTRFFDEMNRLLSSHGRRRFIFLEVSRTRLFFILNGDEPGLSIASHSFGLGDHSPATIGRKPLQDFLLQPFLENLHASRRTTKQHHSSAPIHDHRVHDGTESQRSQALLALSQVVQAGGDLATSHVTPGVKTAILCRRYSLRLFESIDNLHDPSRGWGLHPAPDTQELGIAPSP